MVISEVSWAGSSVTNTNKSVSTNMKFRLPEKDSQKLKR